VFARMLENIAHAATAATRDSKPEVAG
jgi:hypothetical protein